MIIRDPSHSGIVKNGKFIPDAPEIFKADFENFEGLRCEVSVKEIKRKNEFNAYYWAAIVRTFVTFFNEEKTFNRRVKPDFVHEILAAKFLGFTQQTMPDGEVLMMRTPSRNLTQSEFKDYTKYCKAWGEELFDLKFPDMPKPEQEQ